MLNKPDRWEWDLPFTIGKLTGMLERDDVIKYLYEMGLTYIELRDLKHALAKVTKIFYEER